MFYNGVIKGKFIDLRSITEADAEFSFRIRSSEKNCNLVGQPASSVDDQRKYIVKQMRMPNDYYFVVMNKRGESIGLIGVYNIQGDIGEVGRKVCDGNPAECMEMDILIADFCRDVLRLKKAYYLIFPHNKNLISMNKKGLNNPMKMIHRDGYEYYYYETDLDINKEARVRRLLAEIEVD